MTAGVADAHFSRASMPTSVLSVKEGTHCLTVERNVPTLLKEITADDEWGSNFKQQC